MSSNKGRMMRRILISILFSCFTINSFACICWFATDKKSVKDKIAKADVILYVMAMPDSLSENLQPGDSTLHVSEVVFKIIKTWKGKELTTERFKAKRYPCEDAGYRVGERYIIFGYLNKETGQLETNNCNSLCEETIPDPLDKLKMKSANFDFERYQKATLEMRQEFEVVEKLIDRQTRR
jgi:hypothetical protein